MALRKYTGLRSGVKQWRCVSIRGWGRGLNNGLA